MSAPDSPRMRIPLPLILLDVVGAAAAGLGFYGLAAETPPPVAPALGDPLNAWLLVALGGGMMGYAVFEIVRLAAKAGRGG
jgi:hypothetical protein